jgi:hypothetical protein
LATFEGLDYFMFENGQQHKLFYEILMDKGVITPFYPIYNADPRNLDDWLFVHNQMHEQLASTLNLDNPFQLLDSDWKVEEELDTRKEEETDRKSSTL